MRFFFLWRYLKSKVYTHRSRKDVIRQEIAAIQHEMTRRVMENFRERLQQCVESNGTHLTDFVFKTK